MSVKLDDIDLTEVWHWADKLRFLRQMIEDPKAEIKFWGTCNIGPETTRKEFDLSPSQRMRILAEKVAEYEGLLRDAGFEV